MDNDAANTVNIARQDSGGIALAEFSPQELARVQEIKQQININDPQAIITYGVRAQRDIASSADTILDAVRANDSSNAGGVLNNLVLTVKEADVDSINEDGFFTKMPFFDSLLNPFNKFIGRYEKISVQIEKIADELDAARMSLLKDITLLEKMYAKNNEYKKNLDLYIAAGELKQQELTEVTLPLFKAKAQQTKLQEDEQVCNDLDDFISSIDKKLTDLKLSRMVALQTAVQIKLIQSGNQALFEKIQSSILNTIPLWKNQIVIAISLFRQRKALKLQKGVTSATNSLLEKNAETLKENTIGIAKQSAGSLVEISTLKKVNNNLIDTIEAALQIQADGKAKRQQAEQELLQIEGRLKDKLADLQS